ncbi:MAG: hypothetical protein V4723_02130 [Pseudomonadota bacterium]
MNVLKKMDGGTSWWKCALVVVLSLMPIWFAPIRTAPVDSHLMVWALIVVGSFLYCYGFMGPVDKTVGTLLTIVSCGAVGIIPVAWVAWDLLVNLGDEGKMVCCYLIGAVSLWFMLTHTKEDGSVQLW